MAALRHRHETGFAGPHHAEALAGQIVGEVEGLRQAIRETDAECVVVASSALFAEQMRRVAKAIRLEAWKSGSDPRFLGQVPTPSTRLGLRSPPDTN